MRIGIVDEREKMCVSVCVTFEYVLMCCCCCHLMMCAEELGIRYGLFDGMGKERGGEERGWGWGGMGWKERAWWWLGWGLIAKMDEGMSMLVLFKFMMHWLTGLRDVRHVPH